MIHKYKGEYDTVLENLTKSLEIPPNRDDLVEVIRYHLQFYMGILV